jgi:D-3-phosphoglycerate dehydrogenase
LKEHAEVVNTFDNPESIDAILLRNIPVKADLMDRCKNLKVIGKHGVGVNTIDLEAAKQRGIIVVNTPKANSNSVAELAVALILNAARNVCTAQEKTQAGGFKTLAPASMTGVEITGKTLGTIGIGNIGRLIANILHNGFGMKVLAYYPRMDRESMAKLGYEKVDSVEELISRSDVVNVSVPLTPETKNMISGDMFNHFKKDAILVNTARGGIINEEDLYEALKSGKLRAAACDAFVQEPPTRETTKLFELDNFVGTPHIGACSEEALERMGKQVVTEIITILNGGEPVNRVV